MAQTEAEWKKSLDVVAKSLKNADNIMVIAHKSPDADTLGSALALCLALRGLGKKANVFVEEKVPPKIRFLLDGYEAMDFDAQFMVCVDVASKTLLPEGVPQEVDVCVDHHKNNDITAVQKLVVEDASATGEIMFGLVKALGAPVSGRVGQCLYCAISSDTGCFKYSNTTVQAHLIAAELMELGVDYAQLNYNMFELETKKDFELLRVFLSKMEFYFSGVLAVAAVSEELLKSLDMEPEDVSAGLAAELIRVQGVKVGVLLKERGAETKASFRTLGAYDASKLAAIWGGGGHLRASGCLIKKPLEVAKQEIISKLGAALGEVNDGGKCGNRP